MSCSASARASFGVITGHDAGGACGVLDDGSDTEGEYGETERDDEPRDLRGTLHGALLGLRRGSVLRAGPRRND